MIVSPRSSSGASDAIVASTNAAGTMIHTWRGAVELADEVVERAGPRHAVAGEGRTAFGSTSKPTHSWPAPSRRRTMFAPIRPRPIMPSCMRVSLARGVRHVDARDSSNVERTAVATSHRGLEEMLAGLAGRGALDVGAPSLLPGWSVGHVLTHLARNADSMTYVLGAAGPDDVVERYVGGVDGRNGDIEAGAGRSAIEQLADLRRADEDLDACSRPRTGGPAGARRCPDR